MYIQSGKEYVLKGPGDYTVGEREIAVGQRHAPGRARDAVAREQPGPGEGRADVGGQHPHALDRARQGRAKRGSISRRRAR